MSENSQTKLKKSFIQEPVKRDDIFYKALETRDHRFDGQFFVGVKTTGIYCRPICPAKPKRVNVEFYQSSWAAERAGYRPCLRCRPESAPRSAAWIGTSALVQRAIKVLHHPEMIGLDEDRLAERFGVSARHLRRVFVDEIGKTPKQLSFENRLNLARQLIIETSLPMSEIAFAAGFSSIRRFNDAFKDRFKRNPTEIRRERKTEESSLRISLSYRPPFDFLGLLQSYRSHQIGLLEWFEDDRMHRVVSYNGHVGKVVISDDPENSRLQVEIDFPNTRAIHFIVSRIRSLFDLDSDPLIIANSLEQDTALKKILKKHPGVRLPTGWDPFEVSVSTILGQLVSVSQARTLVLDLINRIGSDSGLKYEGEPIRLFPTPQQLARADLTFLKTTQVRKKTLKIFSQSVAEKKISLEPTQDVEQFMDGLMKISGIGRWTADYMALKVLRHADVFPATDLILSRALEIHPLSVVDTMSPWRGYVATLLWREYAESLKKSSLKKRNKGKIK